MLPMIGFPLCWHRNMTRVEALARRIRAYRKDPVRFSREVLNFEPDEWQCAVLLDLAGYPRVSVRSGQGVGKTGVEGVAALWFLSCFPYARVVATAPTRQQLNDVLWAEIAKWLNRSPILPEVLTWTKTRVYVNGNDQRWFAVARTATKAENMQGFHEDNMLFIVDEASGVAEPIMEAIRGTLSGANNKLLLCGNPTKTTGSFYDSHHADRASYRCHQVNSELSPRTNKENIEALARKYGRDSNVFRVRVLGEFPLQEDDVFIPLTLVEQGIITELEATVTKIAMGVDVARFGDDETVIATDVSGDIEIPVVRHGQDLMRTVGDIVILYRKLIEIYPDYKGPITCNIDETGLGGGVADRLEEVKVEQHLNRLEIVPVNASSAPPKDGEEHYADITTYMWATVRDLLRAQAIHLQNDNDLIGQLSVRKYGISSHGKIVLESKKDMKKRGIKSPDRADAVALACFRRKKIFDTFVNNIQAIIIPTSAVKAMRIERIFIGVSSSLSLNMTAFVATGIVTGYKRAVVLRSEIFSGSSDTDAVGKAFAEFAMRVRMKYGQLNYAYCDPDEYIQLKGLKKSASNFNLAIAVRSAVGESVAERILLTKRLISQNRLSITEDCDTLTRALAAATWSDKGKADTRGDTADAITLNAFEWTVERDGNKFIKSEV